MPIAACFMPRLLSCLLISLRHALFDFTPYAEPFRLSLFVLRIYLRQLLRYFMPPIIERQHAIYCLAYCRRFAAYYFRAADARRRHCININFSLLRLF